MADKYGVDEAIIIENLYFWIAKNKANKKHFYDGYYWTYNSTRAFKELFTYWSERQIDRILKSLNDKGAILIGNYNKAGYDRTRWFTLSTLVTDIIPYGEMDIPKTYNAFTDKVGPIPVINTVVNTDILIAQIWSLYPKKDGKKIAITKITSLVKKYGYEKIKSSVEMYILDVKSKRKAFPGLNYQNGSTFFNNTCENFIEKVEAKGIIIPLPKMKVIVRDDYLEQ